MVCSAESPLSSYSFQLCLFQIDGFKISLWGLVIMGHVATELGDRSKDFLGGWGRFSVVITDSEIN